MAILAVFAGHTGASWAHPGFLGVQVFFVLSGYLITSLLLREWELRGQITLRRFYERRVLRLYPALLGALVIGLIFYRDIGDHGTLAGYGHTAAAAGLYVEDFVYSFSGPHGGLEVTWSLAVEEQFYLLWPPLLLIVLRRGRRRLAPTLGAFVLVNVVVNQVLIHEDFPRGYFFTPWLNATPLIVGCFLAVVLADHRDRLSRGRFAVSATLFGVAGLVAMWIVVDLIGNGHFYSFLLLGSALSAAALIVGLELAPTTPVARWLSWKPIAGLGLVSYGFYLYHEIFLTLVTVHLHDSRFVNSIVALAITLAASILSFYAIEMPFLRIKARLAGPSLATPADEDSHDAESAAQPSVVG